MAAPGITTYPPQPFSENTIAEQVIAESVGRYAERFQLEFPHPPSPDQLAMAQRVAEIAVDVFKLLGAAERRADFERLLLRNSELAVQSAADLTDEYEVAPEFDHGSAGPQ